MLFSQIMKFIPLLLQAQRLGFGHSPSMFAKEPRVRWFRILYWHITLYFAELRGLDLQTGIFTLKQIKAATKNFDAENKVGEGGFGSVYKVIACFISFIIFTIHLKQSVVCIYLKWGQKWTKEKQEHRSQLSQCSPHLISTGFCDFNLLLLNVNRKFNVGTYNY